MLSTAKNVAKRKIRRKIILLILPLVAVIIFLGLAIEGASYVVDTVTSFFTDGVEGFTGIFKQDVITWSENMTDEEIKKIMTSGVGVHPKKFGKYINYENESIPQNTVTKRRTWVETHTTKVNAWPGTSGIPSLSDHELDLNDRAYPYRLFYESLLGVDFLNNTSDYENKLELLNKAKKDVESKGLASVLDWSFKYSKNIRDNRLYYDVDYNSFEYEETRFDSFYTKTETFREGEMVGKSEFQTDYRYSYPIPYLNSVKTMFSDYDFEYEKVVLELSDWQQVGPPIVESWTTREYSHTEYEYDEEGNVISSERIYDIISWKSVTTNEARSKIEKDLPLPYASTDNTYFLEFLKGNKVDYTVDPYLVYEITTKLPDSMDFAMPLSRLLDTEFNPIDYGNLDLNLNIDTTDSSWLESIPYIYQIDPRWKNLPYGRQSTIGASGCGPTSVAIVLQAYKNAGYNINTSSMDLDRDGIVNPYEAGVWSVNNGYRAYGAGTYWSYFAGVGREVGLNVTQVGKTAAGGQQVLNALSQGKLVIASMSRGTFTRGGHFIVLAGLTSDGKIIVRDSNSSSRSYTTYNFASPVFSEANAFWIMSP